MLLPTSEASAQGLPLIRDAEIESLLSDYASPIFRAAGLGSGRIAMRIVRNDAFNAFVVDGRNVFVHTGALLQSETPNQVIGVIAHETGHIAGGHMAALRSRIARDQTKILLAQVLGILLIGGAAATGGDTGRDIGSAGQAVMQGGSELIMRSLLAERRSQEAAADQAGLKYLNATGQSGLGMLETFERFAQQEYISDTHKDTFARSHPVASDRLARLRELVRKSPNYSRKDTSELQLRHDLMRAKLSGYLENPRTVFNRYPKSDTSLPARYARALARFFLGGNQAVEQAVAETDALIRDKPSYPYFWETKADLLMRAGRAAQAIAPLRRAMQLANSPPLMKVELATALQSVGDEKSIAESVSLLRKALIDDVNPTGHRLLAGAYYKQGKLPQADAETAQAYFLEGNLKQAQIFAKRAQRQLRKGSPEWLRSDDIINYKPET
ncbi:MAG: M48 family metallopeptidase [Hyphomicrobiaceae bacterium]|nr:M48 family metallopeptidase [Hyphomicrobiaceae bacterium]